MSVRVAAARKLAISQRTGRASAAGSRWKLEARIAPGIPILQVQQVCREYSGRNNALLWALSIVEDCLVLPSDGQTWQESTRWLNQPHSGVMWMAQQQLRGAARSRISWVLPGEQTGSLSWQLTTIRGVATRTSLVQSMYNSIACELHSRFLNLATTAGRK